MKTFKVLFILIFVFSGNLKSATDFGVRIGYNLSKWVQSTNGYSVSTKTTGDINGSIAFDFKVTEIFSIQPELGYIKKGGTITQDFFASIINVKYNITYIEVPVFAKLSFGNDRTKFNFLIGPSIGYGISGLATATVTTNGQTETEEEKLNFERDHVSRTDICLNVGIGPSFQTSHTTKVYFDVRFQKGLSNIADAPESLTPTYDLMTTNESFIFSFGFFTTIGGGKKNLTPMLKPVK
jgi:hypothetical protein